MSRPAHTLTGENARRRASLFSRLAAAAVALTLAAGGVLGAPAPAMAWRSGADEIAGSRLDAPDIDAAAGILVAPDGRVLWSRNGESRRAMASTTKMMTALLAVENGGLNRKVRISKAASRAPYGLGLKEGEWVTAGKLLELALVASGNDAAYALGEHVSGDMRSFVDRMNVKARALGLKDTHFANPHGLDAPGHYSTPSDLAVLANAAMRKPAFRRAVAMRQVTFPAGRGRPARGIKSTDKLLGKYGGLLGVKTGFTGDAGYSFVAQARRGGVTLTAVILGARSNPARFAQSARLLDWGFRHYRRRDIAWAGSRMGGVPLAADSDRTVPALLDRGASAFTLGVAPIEREVSLSDAAELPVLKGQRLGEVTYRQGGRTLARLPAVAAESLVSVEETVATVPVSDYLNRTVVARTAEITSPIPAFDPGKPIEQDVDVRSHVEAPVAAGTRLGEVTYRQGGRAISVPIVAAESVKVPGLVDKVRIALTRSWRGLLGGPPMAQLEVVRP